MHVRARTRLAIGTVALDRDLETEDLEVDDSTKGDGGSDEVHDVRKTVAPECLAKSSSFVVPRKEEMEESDDGTFEFGSTAGVDGSWGERLPDD